VLVACCPYAYLHSEAFPAQAFSRRRAMDYLSLTPYEYAYLALSVFQERVGIL
jgi:hypothetical protein